MPSTPAPLASTQSVLVKVAVMLCFAAMASTKATASKRLVMVRDRSPRVHDRGGHVHNRSLIVRRY